MLSTKRLLLRGPQPSDLTATFAAYSDPMAMRFWSTAPHENIDVTHEKLAWRIDDFAKHPRNFEIILDGDWVGHAGMYRDFEVGFMLSRAHWRQGIISEVMHAIIPHLFETIRVPYMTADVDPLNDASCGILQKLGFHETHRAENTFCINDHWSDSVYYRLDPPKI
jgi:ribosomal-protein-alanine N-acetyltransferase